MSLPTLLGDVADYLDAALGHTVAQVGGTRPADPDDLPAVTLWASDASYGRAGLGRMLESGCGALIVEVVIDLANPVLDLGDEQVRLLSGDRSTLHFPHAPLVRADGSPDGSFGAADLQAALGGTAFVIVNADPAAGQARPDATSGELHFGVALPAQGSLWLRYHIGQWEMRTTNLRATLVVEVAAADAAATDGLSRQVDEALEPSRIRGAIQGVRELSLVSWGATLPPAEAGARERTRILTYDLAFERMEPFLPSGGGVIRRIAVENRIDLAQERFDVA
jgi:hypothetical protein